ncbi:hypothetical protein [Cognaticolwellia beringensis]|nr:hypothetical protein [Cognaticolwellia beringensis]
MRKGTYSAILFSLIIHGIILFLMLMAQANKPKIVKSTTKIIPIKSFIYYPPNVAKTDTSSANKKLLEKEPPIEATSNEQTELNSKPTQKNLTPEITKNALDDSPLTGLAVIEAIELPETNNKTTEPKPLPNPTNRKLDSFTQLQKLRSTLNKNSVQNTDNPYQSYQPPSVFNTNSTSVPHSFPMKDVEKEREKNTKNMGSGIAITKGDDGRCSVTQDLSVYGLSEGSSTQFFSCGESKFDKSFREHMRKVKSKLGKD